MALAASVITYFGTGPTKTGQVIAGTGNDPAARTLCGKFTLISDGSATTTDVNWIDGTEKLPYTPSGVLLTRIGGDETTQVSCDVTAITDTKMSLKVSGAGTNTKKFIYTVQILK